MAGREISSSFARAHTVLSRKFACEGMLLRVSSVIASRVSTFAAGKSATWKPLSRLVLSESAESGIGCPAPSQSVRSPLVSLPRQSWRLLLLHSSNCHGAYCRQALTLLHRREAPHPGEYSVANAPSASLTVPAMLAPSLTLGRCACLHKAAPGPPALSLSIDLDAPNMRGLTDMTPSVIPRRRELLV